MNRIRFPVVPVSFRTTDPITVLGIDAAIRFSFVGWPFSERTSNISVIQFYQGFDVPKNIYTSAFGKIFGNYPRYLNT